MNPSIFRRVVLLSLGLVAIMVVALPGRGQSAPTAATLNLSLETFVAPGQITEPVAIAGAGDDRLFVVERAGAIRVVQSDGTVLGTPFLDIGDLVFANDSSEQGLLGLVFHPDYAENGYFYVNYTTKPDGDADYQTHISRFSVTADPNVADPNSEQIILDVSQPYSNHNAGDLAFGPDGYLYIPLGDGGAGNDPENRAQDGQSLLGKMLRVDVDDGSPYAIPPDNPFVGDAGVRDEIWLLGLRNPWRVSFDAVTGDLWIGDVGQGAWEEVDVLPAGTSGGQNFGWSCFEGDHENPNTHMTAQACQQVAQVHVPPVFEYDHGDGCAVTGGYVYRGRPYFQMRGHTLLTDYCSGNFWDVAPDGMGGWQATLHQNLQDFGYVSFGQDVDGELYVADISDGAIYHLQEDTTLVAEVFLPLAVQSE